VSQNLDLVRSIYAAWERGDYGAIEWADKDIEFAWADGPEPGGRTGLPEMAEGWNQWLAAWDDFRSEAEEYREIDGERVLVLGRNTGRGKTSGLDLRQRPTKQASLFHVRNGKVTRLVLYWDRDRALADLGLEQ
jgi:ketosteroid isomerase-like protein